MSHLRAPATRADRREGGRHGRPVARPAPAPVDTPLRPQLLRLAVLPPVAVALSGAAVVLFTVRSTGAHPGPSLWAVLAGGVSVTLAGIVIAAVAATRAATAVHDRIDVLRRGTARREAELRALVDGLRQGEVPPRRTPHRAPPAGGDEFELLDADLARAHDGAVTAVVRAAQLSGQAGNEQKLEVFLNLARRLQSLVHREISILDELENEIEDPDLLKGLFHVDHLATRIRRHAENLAVLGGAVSRRQWSHPVSMTEVLRSAIAEVEQYSRVKLVPPVDGTLHGHAVADVIHLLAELVENATLFSAPQTQVLLRAGLVTSGLAVEVEDRGLGMPVAEQARMNALLADPDQVNVASLVADGRIGLFVVSQLARRHGISVRLQSNIYGGVQAVLVVPQALLGAPHGDQDDARTPQPLSPAPAGRRRPLPLPPPQPAHRPGPPGSGAFPSPRHAAGAHAAVPETGVRVAASDAGGGRHAGPYAPGADGGHPGPTVPDGVHPGYARPSGSSTPDDAHPGTPRPSRSAAPNGGHRGAAAAAEGPSGFASPIGGRRAADVPRDEAIRAPGAYAEGVLGGHADATYPGMSGSRADHAAPGVGPTASGVSGEHVDPAASSPAGGYAGPGLPDVGGGQAATGLPDVGGGQAGTGVQGAGASDGCAGSASAEQPGDARPAPAGPNGAPAPLPRRADRGQRPNPADAAPGIRPEYRPTVATTTAVPLTPRVGAVRGTMGRPQLPRRRAQEHIVPQLRGGPAPRRDSEEPVGHDPGLMAAFQRGVGLAEARQHLEPDHLPSPQRTSPEWPGLQPLPRQWTAPEAPLLKPARPERANPEEPHPGPLHSEWTRPEASPSEPPRPERTTVEEFRPQPSRQEWAGAEGPRPEPSHWEPSSPERTTLGQFSPEPTRQEGTGPEPPRQERISPEGTGPEGTGPEPPRPEPSSPEWVPAPAGPGPVREAGLALPAEAFVRSVPAVGAPSRDAAATPAPGAVPEPASAPPGPDGPRHGVPPTGDDLTVRPDGSAPAG
ncbi:ATP-binding protein [Streptomyces sp. NPDC003697]